MLAELADWLQLDALPDEAVPHVNKGGEIKSGFMKWLLFRDGSARRVVKKVLPAQTRQRLRVHLETTAARRPSDGEPLADEARDELGAQLADQYSWVRVLATDAG